MLYDHPNPPESRQILLNEMCLILIHRVPEDKGALRRVIESLLSIFALLWCSHANSQCVNSIVPTCDVYQKCFAKTCNCKVSPDEYFIAFGASYCKAFLENPNFSPEGKKWRDSTLRCLQEAIVPALPNTTGGTCDCGAAKRYALSTHVACYTQQSSSVCSLPGADVLNIAGTILADKSFKKLIQDKDDALRQALATTEICSGTAPDPVVRSIWMSFRSALTALSITISNPAVINASFSTFHQASQRTASVIDDRMSAMGFLGGLTTNTSRTLYMDLLRAYGIAEMRFGLSCFDQGCGVLTKAVIGKRKPASKNVILDLGVVAIGRDSMDAFAKAVTSNGLEAPLTGTHSAYEIDKTNSYYFWTTKGGIYIYPY